MTEALSRRRWLRQVAAAAVLVPGGVAGLIREALAAGLDPATPGIQRLKGDVRVNGEPARVGMLVKAGDTVSTGSDGEVIYVIERDAFLQRGNSSVSFGADAAQKLMRVLSGKILSVFGKGERKINVSTATIGIRGTACYIEDEGPKLGADGTAIAGSARTYFCLCYGGVELTPSAAPSEATSYTTTRHDHPIYIYDDMKMPTMMVSAPVINHTDAELEMLEALCGRRTPFASSGYRY